MTAYLPDRAYLALRAIQHSPGPFSRHWLAAGVFAPAVLVIGSGGVFADTPNINTSTWTGGVNDEWFEGGNWDGDIPVASDQDTVTRTNIDEGDNQPVIGADENANAGTLRVGTNSAGTLTIEGGGTLDSDTSRIGSSTLSEEADIISGSGFVTVSGEGSEWNTGGSGLLVGSAQGSAGTLEIQDSATVRTGDRASIGSGAGSVGTVAVEEQSEWSIVGGDLEVGRDGTGELTIESGGEVSTTEDQDLVIGNNAESSGTVIADGPDSEIDVGGRLFGGGEGDGVLEIRNGAQLKTTEASRLGSEEGSSGEVIITGSGSHWEETRPGERGGSLLIGQGGEGRLTIADGATVDARSTSLGSQDNSTFEVAVDGEASQLTTDSITVGTSGQGTLTVSGGASLVTSGPTGTSGVATIGRNPGADGTVQISGQGSNWQVDEGLTVGGSALGGAQGLLRVEDGGEVTVGELDIGKVEESVGTVIVNNSELHTAGDITLGLRTNTNATPGQGYLFVEEGATVTSRSGTIADASGSVGEVGVSGEGSRWEVDGDIDVGSRGDGLLHVGDGAAVIAGEQVSIALREDSAADVTVNGVLVSGDGIDVGAGGILRGDGVVRGNTTVQGMIAPGNSIGGLSVEDGDLTFADGSIYRVEVNDGGEVAGVNNDFVGVDGSILIEEGATLHVTSESGTDDGSTYASETTFRILSAEQEVEGEFSAVTDDFAFLSSSLEYAEDEVSLILSQIQGFEDAARTDNQRATAAVLDQESDNADMDSIVGTVITMDEADARAAFDDLSGVDHTHAQQISVRGGPRFRAGLMKQLAGPVSTGAPGESANLEQVAGVQPVSTGQRPQGSARESEPGRDWWIRAEGGRGDIDSTSNASGADYDFGGLSAGFDVPIAAEWRMGAAIGFMRNRGDSAGGDVDVDSFHLAGYGGWQRDPVYVRGAVGLTYHDIETERSVETVGETADADYSARGVGSRIEAGYVVDVAEAAQLTPFAGFDYEQLRRKSFNESGAGAASLEVDRAREYSLRSQLGLRFEQGIDTASGPLAAYAEVAWLHELGDRSSRMKTAFSGAPGSSFSIKGPELSRDRAGLGAGVSATLNQASSLDLSYQGEIAGSDDLHSVGLTFRHRW